MSNKEKSRASFKKWYSNPENRRKHNEKLLVMVYCPKCGSSTCKNNLKKHMTTKLCEKRRAIYGGEVTSGVFELQETRV